MDTRFRLGVIAGLIVMATTIGIPASAAFPPNTPLDQLPQVVGWGSNSYGELGDGTWDIRPVPVVSTGGDALSDLETTNLSSSHRHTCSLTDGQVRCWGLNLDGQLGVNAEDVPKSAKPQEVTGDLAGKWVTAVSAGGMHTCAIAGGQLYCWGNNDYGQLGIGGGDEESEPGSQVYPSPQLVEGALRDKYVTDVSAGDMLTCAIASGQAYCWGSNWFGGVGANIESEPGNWNVPVPVPVDTTGPLNGKVIDTISVGQMHACAIAEGRAYCWGRNSFGELGANSNDPSSLVPVSVDHSGALSGKTIVAIDAGGDHTCALAGVNGSRRAYCWGYGDFGGIGNGSDGDAKAPVAVDWTGVLNGRSASSLSVGSLGSCVVADGTGYCWGSDIGYRLGDGLPLASSTVPVTVASSGALTNRRLLTVNSGHYSTLGVSASVPSFSDVGPVHPFHDDIFWAAGSGIAQGYANSTYQPGQAISRQAMAAFMYRYKNPGAPDPTCDPNVARKFVDVTAGNAFCGVVEWLANEGIVDLPQNQKFQPAAPMTRGNMATWMFRGQHHGLADRPCTGGIFTDVSEDSPACGNIEWLARTGITTGYADNTFQPSSSISRAAMTAFLHRAQELFAH